MIVFDNIKSFNNNFKPVVLPNLKYSELQTNFVSNYVVNQFQEIKIPTQSIKFSDITNFNSLVNGKSVVDASKLKYSTGLYPYYDRLDILLDENSTYDDINEVLENINVDHYWFDNSIPSKEMLLQGRVISWNLKSSTNIQLSIRLPKFITDFEYNVSNINTDSRLSYEYDLYPKTSDSENLNFMSDIVFADQVLNWEWAPGLESRVALNIEYEKIPGQSYLLNFEYIMGYILDERINFEYKNVYITDSLLNWEYNIEEISRFGKLQIEYMYGLESLEDLNLEYLAQYSSQLNFETLLFANYEKDINYEFVKVLAGDVNINYEYKNVYVVDELINYEVYTDIDKSFPLNYEYYNDVTFRKLNFEFKKCLYR